MPNAHYKKVALGGTFDHLHIGHRAFFAYAFQYADHVVIGLTLPELSRHKEHAHAIESYELRAQTLQEYLHTEKYDYRYTIVPLSDIYGTTLRDPTIEALIVTPMTEKGAVRINTQRGLEKKNILPIHVCEMVRDENGEYVSSSRIREGCIDREGRVYRNLLLHNISLNEKQKTSIRNIEARILSDNQLYAEDFKNAPATVLVGDVVTKTFFEKHMKFSIAYIDEYTQHKEVSVLSSVENIHMTHPAGQLQENTFDHIFQHKTQLSCVYKIDGEEDLIAVEAILALPLGSRVVYGNPFPPQGIGIVLVDELIKLEIKNIILTTSAQQALL